MVNLISMSAVNLGVFLSSQMMLLECRIILPTSRIYDYLFH